MSVKISGVGRASARVESRVRYYAERFPTVFDRALNAEIWNTEGRRYIDFFSAASSLNYGHNHPQLKTALLAYMAEDGVVTGLDTSTAAKEQFIARFDDHQMTFLGEHYRLMFTGPTGTNAVEAAMKLARRATGRPLIGAFTNAFHGMSLGALSGSGSRRARRAGGLPMAGVERYPFDGYFGPQIDTLTLIAQMIEDPSSGYDVPAAFILETVQAEGGLNVASTGWLQRLADLCCRHEILLIVDDIQAGCGRTGSFFSFERAGLRPDIICLSKSLSGLGLPLSMVMVREKYDQLDSGEHTGTFRGNNYAFITAEAALGLWAEPAFQAHRAALEAHVEEKLSAMAARFGLPESRGIGLLRGLELADGAAADRVARSAFEGGLLVETCGPRGQVVKVMPPLTAPLEVVDEGLEILSTSLNHGVDERAATPLKAVHG